MSKLTCEKCNRPIAPGSKKCRCGAIVPVSEEPRQAMSARADSIEDSGQSLVQNSEASGLPDNLDGVPSKIEPSLDQFPGTLKSSLEGNEDSEPLTIQGEDDSNQEGTSKGTPTPNDLAAGGGPSPIPSPSPGELLPQTPSGQSSGIDALFFEQLKERTVRFGNELSASNADYLVVDQIGKGGFGFTYSAFQTALKRKVAIKQLQPLSLKSTFGLSQAEKQKVERSNLRKIRDFYNEAVISSRLAHPNIPPIYEMAYAGNAFNSAGSASLNGEVDTDEVSTVSFGYFYSMQFCAGNNWSVSIKDTKKRDKNLGVFAKIANALSHAHSQGIIHRDINPKNVMVGEFDDVFLIDWGLAYDLTSGVELRPAGTPGFMAPESTYLYKASEDKDVDERSDIYSLGSILYEIVTGNEAQLLPRELFEKKVNEQLEFVRNAPIATSDSKDPLLSIALKAMSYKPQDRYQSVQEMLGAMDCVKDQEESVRITDRTIRTAAMANADGDYQLFTESLFGFKDAIERWPENVQAIEQLRQVRYDYAKCAYDKGDYDLVLQTVDRTVATEDSLYRQAQRAQAAVQKRASRFRLLRNAFIFTLIGGSAVLGYFALSNKRLADDLDDKNIEISKALAKQKLLADDLDVKNERLIVALDEQQSLAEFNYFISKVEEFSKKEAQDLAEKNGELAKKEFEARIQSQKNAQLAVDALESSRVQADVQKLAIAYDNASLFNYIQANSFLDELRKVDWSADVLSTATGDATDAKLMQLFPEGRPILNNWAVERVKLISNNDLQKLDLLGEIQSIDYSPTSGIGIAIYKKDGGVARIFRDAQGWKVQKIPTDLDLEYRKVTVSPKGTEAVLLAIKKGVADRGALCLLDLVNPDSRPVVVSELREQLYETATYDPSGELLLAGISNGFALRDRDGKWIARSIPEQQNSEFAKTLSGIKGILKDICWDSEGQSAFAIVSESTESSRFLVQISGLRQGPVMIQQIEVSDEVRQTAESIAWLPSALVLGHSDGRLGTYSVIEETSEGASGKSKLVLREIGGGQFKRHKLKVKDILVLSSDVQKDSRGQSGDSRWIVSRSDEATGHFWRVDPNGLLSHQAAFSGGMGPKSLNSTISQIGILDRGRIFVVDGTGTAVVSDLERVAQRFKLSRSNGSDSGTSSPVVDVYNRGGSSQVISVNEEGLVDLWDTQTGESSRFDGERWESYFGHRPGSKWFGAAVDQEAGVVLTLRKVLSRANGLVNSETEKLEVCVWDVATRQMLRSWEVEKNEFDQPLVSTLGHGHFLLSGSVLRIFDYFGNEVTNDLGISKIAVPGREELVAGPNVHFAVRNPKDPNVLAVMKIRGDDTGVAWIWRREPKTGRTLSWFEQDVNDVSDGYLKGRPLEGVWSEDGLRFYVLSESGWVTRLTLSSLDANFTIDSQGGLFPLEVKSDGKPDTRRIAPAWERDGVDLRVTTQSGVDRLEIMIRDYQRRRRSDSSTPVSDSSTTAYVFDISMDGAMGRTSLRRIDGLAWLDQQVSDLLSPALTRKNIPAPRSVERIGTQLMVSTAPSEVYIQELDKVSRVKVLGRRPVVSSACDWAGNELYTLHSDGSIWHLSLKDLSDTKWERYAYEVDRNRRIDSKLKFMSTPTGDSLWLHDLSTNKLQRITTREGKATGEELVDVASVAWRGSGESPASNRGAIVYTDGTIELFEGLPRGKSAIKDVATDWVPKVQLSAQETVEGAEYFVERLYLADGNKKEIEYLVVRTARPLETPVTGSEVRVHFVPLSAPIVAGVSTEPPSQGQGAVSGEAKRSDYFIWPNQGNSYSQDQISSLVVSSEDGTIVTSDKQGAVRVWFGSPTYKVLSEVFDLPTEQDCPIRRMLFSRDGAALITSDQKGRLTSWLGRDKKQSPE